MHSRSKERAKIHVNYQGAVGVQVPGSSEVNRVYLPQADNTNFDPTLSA